VPASGYLMGKHVLVIDDNPASCEVFCQMLRHFGMRPVAAASGEAGMDCLQSAAAAGDPFQLVLLDWLLPGMDGLQTARLILSNSAALGDVPAMIMVTAGHVEGLMAQLATVGLTRVLSKPVSQSSLHDALLEALQGASTAQVHQQNRSRQREPKFDFQRIRHARILLVDDVEINRLVAQAFLAQAGLEAEIAVNGAEAVVKVNQNHYDLVLMDIQMPVLDGLEATRAIRSNPTHTGLPIVAMTAHAMSADRDRSLAAGMNDHLTKPVDPNALFAALLRWIKPGDAGAAAAVTTPTGPEASAADAAAPLPIPALDGIDTGCGLAHHLQRPALYRQILLGFEREFGHSGHDLARALAQADFVLARRLAHSVKSAGASIGALELAQCARQVEDCVVQNQPAGALLAAYQAALQRVLVSLSVLPLLAGAPVAASVAAQAVPVEVTLALIDRLQALLQSDDAAAGRLLDELAASLRQPRQQDSLQTLRDLIDDVEYPDALKILAQLRHSIENPTP